MVTWIGAEHPFLDGRSVADDGAFGPYREFSQSGLLFKFLSQLLFIILSPSFVSDC